MAALPLAVIGCGLIGLRHAQVATASARVELTSVVEPDPDLREKLIAAGLPAVATMDAVPERTRAAVVATPTPDHAKSGLAALQRGWAVLVEKPVTATLDEADALIAAAERKGLPLVTGHHRRCHPFVQAAHERLTMIKDVVAVQGMWSLRKHDEYYQPDWRRAPGAGPLMTNLSHEIDLLRALLGEIAQVSALTSNAARGLPIEDTAAISLRFENGALGSFVVSDAGASPWAFEAASGENPYIAASGQDYLRITGTAGALAFPSLDLWLGADGQPPTWQNPLVRRAGPSFSRIDPIERQIELFADLAGGRDASILPSGKDGRATLETTLATLLSAQTAQIVHRGEVPGAFRGGAAG